MPRKSRLVPPRDYLCNNIINRIPFHSQRMASYRKVGMQVGKNSTILMATEVHHATGVIIGHNSVINRHCFLDGRGILRIGNYVNISSHVLLVAGNHDIQNGNDFVGSAMPIIIEDYVWLCTRCMILPGVTIGRGSVIAAGAVVTKDVASYTVMAGVPANKIGERNRDLHYSLSYDPDWQ